MPLFNLSALTRHTAYSAAFLLYVAIRKSHIYYAYRVLSWLESVFHILQGIPTLQPGSQLLHDRRCTRTHSKPWQCPCQAAHTKPRPAASPLFRSPEQVEGLWKDHALGLFLPNFTRLMRTTEESLLETGQHKPCRASHLESRGACLPHLHLLPTPSYEAGSVILSPLQRAWTRTVVEMKRNKGEGDFEMKSSYFLISYLKFIASFSPLNKQLICPLQLQRAKLTATCNVKFTLVPFIRISFHIAL